MRISYRILINTDEIENSQYKHVPKPSGFKSWKEYWCVKSGQAWPKKCRYYDCRDHAVRSGHVIVNHDEDFEYIIPMCNRHKSPGFSEIFSVKTGTVAVYLNEEEIMTELVDNLVDNFGELFLKAGDPVKNVSGTGVDKSRDYGSWRKFYIGDDECNWRKTCRISYCTEDADGGGHVHVLGKRGVFIVPMCTKLHNTPHNMDWLSVKRGTIALRVYREDTRRLENKKREANDTRVPIFPDNEAETSNNNIDWLPVKKGTIAPCDYREDTTKVENKLREANNDTRVTMPPDNEAETSNKDSGWSWCIIV